MKTFFDKIDEKDSIYRILIDEHGYKPDEIFDDLVGLLHAAHQTSHHTVCSVLYFIKTRPDWYKKLKDEITHALKLKDGDTGKSLFFNSTQ